MRSPRLFALLLLLVPACGDGSSPSTDPDAASRPDGATLPPDATLASPDASPDPDASPQPACSSWQLADDILVPDGTTRAATIGDGALDLGLTGDRDGTCGAQLQPCSAIMLYQGPMTGDFDVSLDVDELDGDDLFDQVSLVTTSGGVDAMYDQIAVGGSEGHATLMTQHIAGGSESWSTGSVTTHATLHITRVGTQLTLSAVAGSASLSKTYASSYDAYVAITLDPATGVDPSLPVHARVSHFTVTGGGGGAQSDDFTGACALIP